MRLDAKSLSARMLHLLHQFVPDLYSVNTAYSLSGIGRFDKIYCVPSKMRAKMGRNSVCRRQEHQISVA